MQNQRLSSIDSLRGLAMLAMIIIHTSVYFLSTSLVIYYLWDFSEFAVAGFIFCSGYVYFQKQSFSPSRFPLIHLKKRFLRLLIPYYIFMLFFLIAVFANQPQSLTTSYILHSIFLVGGVDINWLVLLFLQLALLMPILQYLFSKQKLFFYLYTFLAITISVLFIFVHIPINYRFVMWLPWSLIVIFSLLLVKLKFFQTTKALIVATLVFGILYLVFREIEVVLHHSLSQFDNKYPPTLYHMVFSIGIVSIFFLLAKKGIFNAFPIKQFLHFLSRYSYSIFFIHYIFVYLISGLFGKYHFTFITFFISVLSLSLVTQVFIVQMKKHLWNFG